MLSYALLLIALTHSIYFFHIVYLVKPYYLIMLSQPIEIEDVKATDPVYYENLWKADTNILSEYISSEKLEENESKTELIR